MGADTTSEPGAIPIMEVRGLRKSFGGVHAVRGVDLTIRRGTIHAIVGENGAGKSTVGKMIAGVIRPSAGEILLDGREVHLHSPRTAIDSGVAMMDQELAMLSARSVLDNVFLGNETSRHGMLDLNAQSARFEELTASTGFVLDAKTIVGALCVADQQKVEILRAAARDARLIVMDEPTAALDGDESKHLHELIRRMRDAGTTIIFVSHFLEEVLSLADTVTVMRDGLVIQTTPASGESVESLVNAMLGRSLEITFPPRVAPLKDTDPTLEARGLTSIGRFEGIDLALRPGEIVGLAGLVGSGRSEVARALFGADPVDAGSVLIDGKPIRLRSPKDAVRHGIALVPESRKDDGLMMLRSVRENIGLVALRRHARGGFVRSRADRVATSTTLERLSVPTARSESVVSTLSGGNQQKVLFGKWLMFEPRVMLVDEPTRGVDVGAKRAIYELIRELAEDGMAMMIISSELEEILGLADRVVVMHRGRITANLPAAEATEKAILQAAFGMEPQP